MKRHEKKEKKWKKGKEMKKWTKNENKWKQRKKNNACVSCFCLFFLFLALGFRDSGIMITCIWSLIEKLFLEIIFSFLFSLFFSFFAILWPKNAKQ
jgi:hypothetical protein